MLLCIFEQTEKFVTARPSCSKKTASEILPRRTSDSFFIPHGCLSMRHSHQANNMHVLADLPAAGARAVSDLRCRTNYWGFLSFTWISESHDNMGTVAYET